MKKVYLLMRKEMTPGCKTVGPFAVNAYSSRAKVYAFINSKRDSETENWRTVVRLGWGSSLETEREDGTVVQLWVETLEVL